jgi:hypothetical protein
LQPDKKWQKNWVYYFQSELGAEQQRVNVVLSFIDTKDKWKSLGDACRVVASITINKAENNPVVLLRMA